MFSAESQAGGGFLPEQRVGEEKPHSPNPSRSDDRPRRQESSQWVGWRVSQLRARHLGPVQSWQVSNGELLHRTRRRN
jgi:hypothetical protein